MFAKRERKPSENYQNQNSVILFYHLSHCVDVEKKKCELQKKNKSKKEEFQNKNSHCVMIRIIKFDCVFFFESQFLCLETIRK